MKKTCNGCRAEEYVDLSVIKLGCSLGYKTKDGKPLEECPKPTTIKAFVRALQERSGKGE